MPAENLLVVHVLPENDPKAQEAIQVLKQSSADVQVLHSYEQNFRPCVGCNACWLVTPGICAIKDGYEECGNTTEVYYLSDRRQWAKAQNAFQENTNILIALPLYVENIPGILLEFLSGLQPKKTPGTHLAFLLQGGFPEASQSRCCEAFLETLPSQLGCAYAGTLIKGDMFGVGLVDEKRREKMLAPFIEMGRVFASSSRFEKSAVDAFAAPESMSKKQMRTYNLFGKYISRFFMGHIARKLGCKEKLNARPLAE